jgi:hypothetical protein
VYPGENVEVFASFFMIEWIAANFREPDHCVEFDEMQRSGPV